MMEPRPSRPIRIGAVSYLNSKPLIEGLDRLQPEAELLLNYPSLLVEELAAGQIDVGLVPSITCALSSGYEVISDACVAARGPVLSVKLYSRVPIANIRRLALDAGSRTSATLVRVLLAERYGVFPEVEPLPLECSLDSTSADAVLLIGDRAILPPAESFACTWDLGEEWNQWTGLPFVFAVWATRRETDLGPVEQALQAARDEGVREVRQIARREAPLLGLDEQLTLDYLTKNLYYRLGAAEREGLLRFYQLAARHHLVPGGIDLVFRHHTAA